MAYDIQPRASHYVAGEYIDDAAGAEIPVIYAATGERATNLDGCEQQPAGNNC